MVTTALSRQCLVRRLTARIESSRIQGKRMQLTITLDDPDTIALLREYSRFIEQADAAQGTIDQVAEGLILMYLDEHGDFVQWRRANSTTEAAPTAFARRRTP